MRIERVLAPSRFSVNVSMVFTELPFLERFDAVARAGLTAVEFHWPGEDALEAARDAIADAGVRAVLINFDGGDIEAGQRGLLSDPDTVARFRENVPIALEFGTSVGCDMFNALAGLRDPRQTEAEQRALAADSVRWAASLAATRDARVLLEAINRVDVPGYLLATTDDALALRAAAGAANVALQFDCYHAQRGEGNVTGRLRDHIDAIAHVQIADSPDRHEPGSGELNFRFILAELERLRYAGHLGLEYVPTEASAESVAAVTQLLT